MPQDHLLSCSLFKTKGQKTVKNITFSTVCCNVTAVFKNFRLLLPPFPRLGTLGYPRMPKKTLPTHRPRSPCSQDEKCFFLSGGKCPNDENLRGGAPVAHPAHAMFCHLTGLLTTVRSILILPFRKLRYSCI